MSKADLPLLTFSDAVAFEVWMAEQGTGSPGCWLRFAKKGAPEATLAKSEAIDAALAHGWIDGQLGRLDGPYFKTRFTPRKAGSAWSKLNRERAERLIAAGRMTAAGQAEVDRAKADGRWARAYDAQSRAEEPADFIQALDADPAGRAFYDGLNAANRFAALYRIQQAKTPQKRAAKIAAIVARLARREAFHPLKTGKSRS